MRQRRAFELFGFGRTSKHHSDTSPAKITLPPPVRSPLPCKIFPAAEKKQKIFEPQMNTDGRGWNSIEFRPSPLSVFICVHLGLLLLDTPARGLLSLRLCLHRSTSSRKSRKRRPTRSPWPSASRLMSRTSTPAR